MTPFARIMRDAVLAIPSGVAGAFAARDGELVDAWTTEDRDDVALLAAHWGVLVAQLRAAYGAWHFGAPSAFVAEHASMTIVIEQVDASYFALLAARPPTSLGAALAAMAQAVDALRREIA